MPELSMDNIERITNDIKKQEITFSHLLEELIDHICCDVEYEMNNGLTFPEAYRRVKQKMTPRRIKEIQEETLYAVDTNYRYMKNTMKISGVAGTVLFGFAALFKIQHWAGAGFMMTLGALILAFVFMPSSLTVLWKETRSSKKLFLFISSFFAATFFIIGILFKVQHWPGAGYILGLAMISGVFLFIPALIVDKLKDQDNRAKRPVYILGAAGLIFFITGLISKIQHWPLASLLMVSGIVVLCGTFLGYTWVSWKMENNISSKFLFMVIGSLAIIVPGAMINLNLQYSYEDGFYPHMEQQQALFSSFYEKNNSFVENNKDSVNYPQMEQVHSRTLDLLSLISTIQVKMVQESEGEPGRPAVSENQIKQTETGTMIIYRNLTKPFHPSPVRDFLLPDCSARLELNKSSEEYIRFVSSFTQDNDLKQYINLVQTSTLLPDDIQNDQATSLISGLHALELLKNNILVMEAKLLTTLGKEKKPL